MSKATTLTFDLVVKALRKRDFGVLSTVADQQADGIQRAASENPAEFGAVNC
jgi:hypothetical protein